MKKRMILAVLSIGIALLAGCGAKTVHALEPTENVEETEVIAKESMEASEPEETETEEAISLKSTVEETESTTEEDYIALVKSCEQEFKILDGKEYNCDIAIEIRGCTYIYEFPGEDVTADECSLFFDYGVAEIINTSEGKLVSIPVSFLVNESKYYIGRADIVPGRERQSNSLIIDEIIYYYGNGYRKTIDYELLKEKSDESKCAIIRDYDPADRTVELCYVTAIDCDTYTDYEIENEEWISVPLSEDAKIVAWSWGYTCSAFVSEEVFDDAVEDWIDNGYFFATIYEGEGCVQGIAQILNP